MGIIANIKKQLVQVSNGNFFESIQTSQFISEQLDLDICTKFVSEKCDSIVGIDGGLNTIYMHSSMGVFVLRIASVSNTHTQTHTWLLQVLKKSDTTFTIVFEPIQATFQLPKIDEIGLENIHAVMGDGSVQILKVANIIRRLVELVYADSQKESIVLIDGSLQGFHSVEKTYLQNLSHKNVLGVCKTTQFITDSHKPVSSVLTKLQPEKTCWIACDVLESKESITPKMYVHFAKLHKNANHIFRIDTFCSQKDSDLISQVASYCDDSVFLGYPYVLIRADELARVSNDEVSYLRNKFYQQFDELTYTQLKQMETSMNTHEILDSLKF